MEYRRTDGLRARSDWGIGSNEPQLEKGRAVETTLPPGVGRNWPVFV
jgi:hypothetical protein